MWLKSSNWNYHLLIGIYCNIIFEIVNSSIPCKKEKPKMGHLFYNQVPSSRIFHRYTLDLPITEFLQEYA